MLADQVDGIIGVDTHRDTLTAAAVSAVGGLLGHQVVAADAGGYRRLLDSARAQIPGRRCFAVEGAGSYGAGLTRLLVDRGEWAAEADRPKRPARRGRQERRAGCGPCCSGGAGPRAVGCASAARGPGGAAGAVGHPPWGAGGADLCHQPAQGPDRGCSRGTAGRAAGRSTTGQVTCCVGLRDRPARSLEHRMTVRALRATAQRNRGLAAEAAELEGKIGRLVAAIGPWLLELPAMGPSSGAQVLVSWSHAGRLGSEGAFAALAGVSLIPASSGQVTRHRLNRGADRRLNRALHPVALVRLRDDPATRACAARPASRGQEPARDPPLRQAGHRTTTVQAPAAVARLRRRGRQGLLAATALPAAPWRRDVGLAMGCNRRLIGGSPERRRSASSGRTPATGPGLWLARCCW
jgi:transposase